MSPSPQPQQGPSPEAIREAVDAIRYPPLRELIQKNGQNLAPLVVPRDFHPGELLCALGADPDGLYFIIAGEVALSRQGSPREFLLFEALHRGDLFGHFALLDDPQVPVLARAVTTTQTLLLPREALVQAAAALPGIEPVLRGLTTLVALKRRFVAAARQTVMLRDVSPKHIASLIDAGSVLELAPGDTVVKEGDAASGLYFVGEGELRALRAPPAQGEARSPMLINVLDEGEVFGVLALITGQPEPNTVVASQPSKVIRVPPESFARLLEESAGFRRAMGTLPPLLAMMGAVQPVPTPPAAMATAGGPPPRPPLLQIGGLSIARCDVTLLQASAKIPPRAVSAMTDLVAQAIATDHGDRIGLLTPTDVAGSLGPGAGAAAQGPGGVWRIPVAVQSGLAGAQDLLQAIAQLRPSYDHLFIDATDRAPDFVEALAPAITRCAFVTGEALELPPLSALRTRPLVYSVLLGAGRKQVGADGMPIGCVRLRLDPAALDGLGPAGVRSYASLAAPMQQTFSRWGRAITERRVGLALGGGGAWGFAHVALIQKMFEAKIPIDIVSGASFGSLAGAFFCAEGLDGLEKLMSQGTIATIFTQGCFITSRSLALYVDLALGFRRLEELEVPLFPVSTDVATSTQYVAPSGTIGEGVRVSGAFPGIFTPVVKSGMRCVDGGFINNVPASVSLTQGGNLVVAGNIVATPPLQGNRKPLLPGSIGEFLYEFNPLGRISDVIRSGLVLMHTNGDRESEFADVCFETTFAGYDFWDFRKGREIAQRAEPDAERAVALIKQKWDKLSATHP